MSHWNENLSSNLFFHYFIFFINVFEFGVIKRTTIKLSLIRLMYDYHQHKKNTFKQLNKTKTKTNFKINKK